ncbi:hypothetical protein J4Q44_G00264930 [Coregonus suidteri]|uniref:Plexin B3 n=1 Tax=Coregonus suidteri TaxID=861788 RepID=A0AAN8QFS0_9TELE
MTEMMDLSSDVGGPGIPFLDYKTYAERVFLSLARGGATGVRTWTCQSPRRQTVEQGLGQLLNNLLNNRLVPYQRDGDGGGGDADHWALLSICSATIDLIPRRCLGTVILLRSEDMLYCPCFSYCVPSRRCQKLGPPDWEVSGEPLTVILGAHPERQPSTRERDIDYCSITLMVKSGVEMQLCPVKVLDTDTITQVKDKILDQIYKGVPFSQRPAADSLDLEWRSGQAGHLTLSDDDVTAVFQGRWKKLNTLQHYKVPDGATVALIPGSAVVMGIHQVYQTGEKMSMLEGEGEEGVRLWHLVKSSEDPEIPKHSSMRERERAKAIPEIYLTRLLSMKGTLQKFVDDVFVAILNTKRPPPIAVRFFFDFLDDMAEKHGIDDPETVHIWKTNSLPLRFWVNILKNPQFVFDVQVTDSVDAVLSVIAQTFIDSCTTSEHKVGRDSPVNKLLYAREIPRYKQLVERYYSDIHSAASGSYQEMNSTLTELSGSFASEMNSLVALHELYKYINKYYDQIIRSLEEDAAGQKMQLAYRLQQVAALVENKVTDL